MRKGQVHDQDTLGMCNSPSTVPYTGHDLQICSPFSALKRVMQREPTCWWPEQRTISNSCSCSHPPSTSVSYGCAQHRDQDHIMLRTKRNAAQSQTTNCCMSPQGGTAWKRVGFAGDQPSHIAIAETQPGDRARESIIAGDCSTASGKSRHNIGQLQCAVISSAPGCEICSSQ